MWLRTLFRFHLMIFSASVATLHATCIVGLGLRPSARGRLWVGCDKYVVIKTLNDVLVKAEPQMSFCLSGFIMLIGR